MTAVKVEQPQSYAASPASSSDPVNVILDIDYQVGGDGHLLGRMSAHRSAHQPDSAIPSARGSDTASCTMPPCTALK